MVSSENLTCNGIFILRKTFLGYGQLTFLYFPSQDEPYKSFGTPWPCSWQALLLKAGAHLMICVGHATTHNGLKSFLKEKYSSFCPSNYRRRAIIVCGLYTFHPLFEVQKRFFKGIFS